MKTFTVTLTEGQGAALLELINLAVKAAGMQAAKAAVELDQVIREGAQAALRAEALPGVEGE